MQKAKQLLQYSVATSTEQIELLNDSSFPLSCGNGDDDDGNGDDVDDDDDDDDAVPCP